MPNWCSTRITINYESREKLQELLDLVEKWTKSDYEKNGFGLSWLGNVVGNSGVGTVSTGQSTDLHCRGYINSLELFDNQFIIDTETAWTPMLKLWIKVLEKYLPGATLLYTAEECGNNIYYTNDPDLVGCYYIDAWDVPGIDSNESVPADKVISILQELLKSTETDIDELINLISASEYSEGLAIHKWEFAESETWD